MVINHKQNKNQRKRTIQLRIKICCHFLTLVFHKITRHDAQPKRTRRSWPTNVKTTKFPAADYNILESGKHPGSTENAGATRNFPKTKYAIGCRETRTCVSSLFGTINIANCVIVTVVTSIDRFPLKIS
jgi:hypothetical protein